MVHVDVGRCEGAEKAGAQWAELASGGSPPSLLATDAYKFAMGQAGFPLRRETFYLSFRRPGWYRIPFDLSAAVHALRPAPATADEIAFLERHGLGLSPAMKAALGGALDITAAPSGSWVREREPILSVTGPSFLVSWLEPLIIALHYPIQLATAAIANGQRSFLVSCADEAAIANLVLERIGLAERSHVEVRDWDYTTSVHAHADAAVRAVGGDAGRLLEVGLRSASCVSMHHKAAALIAEHGIDKTSNVLVARELGLKPVGTTGHEHQMRWGDDLCGFRAVRDMRPSPPSYLFDTFDVYRSGIPAAICALRESPQRPASVRFDSGDALAQLRTFERAGVTPTYIFMDSMRPESIAQLEQAAADLGIAARRRLYGMGGFLIAAAAPTPLVRNRVAAVYKLSQSGDTPVMKSASLGKLSWPGEPRILRRILGDGPVGLIAQAGEKAPAGYGALRPTLLPPEREPLSPVASSAATKHLINDIEAHRFQPPTRRTA